MTPLSAGMAGAPAVVVFGGSFDPVHRWHVRAAAAARRRAGRGAWLLLVPAARSPGKVDGPRAGDADRVMMLRLAARRLVRCEVWTDELDRAGEGQPERPSFTIDTLRRLRGQVGSETRLYLLIGADQAISFHRWREYRAVMGIAEVLVAPRAPVVSAGELARALRATGAWSAEEIDRWRSRMVECGVDPVSSSGVRRAVAQGDAQGAGRSGRLVDPRVLRYIVERGLYRADESGPAR